MDTDSRSLAERSALLHLLPNRSQQQPSTAAKCNLRTYTSFQPQIFVLISKMYGNRFETPDIGQTVIARSLHLPMLSGGDRVLFICGCAVQWVSSRQVAASYLFGLNRRPTFTVSTNPSTKRRSFAVAA